MNKLRKFAFYLSILCFFGTAVFYGEITENRFVGGKVIGKGGAVNADEMGVSSIFFNPAALSYFKKNLGFWVAYGAPYEFVDERYNLQEIAFVAAYNLQFLQVALGFKSTGDFNYLSYNFIYASGAKNFVFTGFFINKIAVGLNLKIIDIHAGNIPTYSGFTMNSDGMGIAFDIGTQIGFFNDALTLGINGKNIVSTPISLISGPGDTMKKDLFISLKYQITKFLDLTLDYSILAERHTVSFLNLFGDSYTFSNLYFGIEFDYFENIEIYTGFNEGSLTVGVGLTDSDFFKLDFGMWVVPGLKMYSQVGLSIMPF